MDIKESISGCIGGFIGQTLCHPFDTIKTRYQTINNYSIFNKHSVKGLYKGISSPLTSVIIEKTLLFSSYSSIKNNFNLNPTISGLVAGTLTTLTVTPFERVKVICQSKNIPVYISLKLIPINTLYRGWTATLFREVPGYGIYFSVYEKVIGRKGTLTPLESFATGSCCGFASWVVIYPSDPIKSVMQLNNIGVKEAINKIYRNGGLKSFYRGYIWGLTRASILHGGVFLGYTMTNNKL